MTYFRILSAAFCFTVFGIGGLLIGSLIFPLIILIFPKSRRRGIFLSLIHHSWTLFVWVMCFLKLIEVKVSDKKALCALEGKIIVANHPSLIDIVVLISLIPKSICIVKGKLAHNFFIKSIIKHAYILNSEDFNTLSRKVENAIKEGLNVIIFPEGTRTDFSIKEPKLHRGFAQLSLRLGVGIIPITIETTPHILGKNQKWYDIGKSTATYRIIAHDEITACKNDKISNHTQAKNLVERVKRKIFNDFLNN